MRNPIVTGYDGSEQSDRALARSAELAEGLGAKLVVVSVAPPMRLSAPELVSEPIDPMLVSTGLAGPLVTGGPMPVPSSPRPDEPDEAQLLLERAHGLLAPRHVDADYLAETGDPAERLLEIADERDAELIVVGSRERNLLGRLLGHRVDEKLPRRTQRDVLLVH